MRVMQINRLFGAAGGVEEYIRTVDDGLRARGHECFAIFQEQAGELRPEDAERNLFCIEGATHPTRAQAAESLARVLALAEKERPHLVYVHVVDHYPLLRELGRRWPVVQFVHSPNVFCPGGGKFWRLRPAVCTRPVGWGCLWHIAVDGCGSRRPSRVAAGFRHSRQALTLCRGEGAYTVVDTDYMREQLVVHGVAATRIAVLPTPVHLQETVSPPPDGRPLILFAGRLAPEKGIDILLQAMPRVRTEAHLMVVGEGPWRDHLKRLVVTLGVAGRVEFRGYLNPDEVHDCYRQAQVVVVPSLWPEPFGMVGPEALGHARPVVGFGVGGTDDWLKDGETGLKARYADPTDLAGKIERLLEDRALAFRLGQQGREHALRRYKRDGHMSRLVELFEDVCRLWPEKMA